MKEACFYNTSLDTIPVLRVKVSDKVPLPNFNVLNGEIKQLDMYKGHISFTVAKGKKITYKQTLPHGTKVIDFIPF